MTYFSLNNYDQFFKFLKIFGSKNFLNLKKNFENPKT